MLTDLQLKWVTHPDSKYADRQYLEFYVGGKSLRQYLGIADKTSVTPLGFFPSKEEQKRILRELRLQQKTKLPGNRVELYVCEDCGDMTCGAITAKIIDRGENVVWAEFANQTQPEEISEIINKEEIEFQRQDYFKALSILQ